MSKHVIKKKDIPIFTELKQILPQWLHSPTLFVTFLLNLINGIMIAFCYIILIGQSARMLASDQKYISVKFLLVKWILFLSFDAVFGQVQSDNFQGVFLKTVFTVFIFLVIYPSQISKSIFGKYLGAEEEQKEKQTSPMTDSKIFSNSSILEKILISLTVFLLKSAKFLLTFIHPEKRKSVEEEIKGINLVLIEEKYFWKIYSSSQKPIEKQIEKAPEVATRKLSFKQSVVQKKESILKDSTAKNEFKREEKNPMIESVTLNKTEARQHESQRLSLLKNSSLKASLKDSSFRLKNPSQQKSRYKKFGVSQYLPLFSTTNRSSGYPSTASKRCTYYRQVQISYDSDSAVMTVTSLEDMKVSYHSLEQIIILEEMMVQFEFEDGEQMIVKFKSNDDYDEFIAGVDLADDEGNKQMEA